MAKRKKLRANKKQAKKTRNKVLNETISAYKKSMKQLQELEARGFVFAETFKKKLYNKIVDMKKPNARTRDFYKKMSYKKELYQQSKGFESEPNKIVSVKEGKRIVRKQNKERKESDSRIYEIRNAIHQYDDGVNAVIRGGHGATTKVDVTEEINRIDKILDNMEEKHTVISDKFKEEVIEDISKIEYGYEDQVELKMNIVTAKLAGGVTDVTLDDMSLIGTPFEDEEN